MRAAAKVLGGISHPLSHNNNNQDSNTNATPTPRPRPHKLRPALQQRDHNVMMRVPPNKPPLASKSGNSMSQNTSRPLQPTLSAGTAKQSNNKTPLTPRVAGTAPQNATTPLSRRGPRSDAGGRDEMPTPVSSFLSNNITPRSGKRTSRVDSTNTTPTGTPTGTPVNSSTSEGLRMAQDPRAYGLGINGADRDVPKRPTVSFSPAVSDIGYSRPSTENADSKFFFASEAKTVQTPSRTPLVAKAPSTFLYANGEPIPPPLQSSGASASGSQVGEERATPKFFHANGTPDLQLAASPHFPPPRPSSVVSSSSRMASPRIGTPSPAGTFSPPQRPSSPSKLNSQYASLAAARSPPSLPSPVLPRPAPIGRGNSAGGLVSARRASIEVQKGMNRTRSSSGSSTPVHGRKASGGSSVDAIPPSTPLNLITNALPVSTPEEIQHDSSQIDVPEIPSPIKAGHSLQKMNELAAEARRERKVLDLEITNSSLEAINRTLEREMRKVTAELRRYRRLSRSGRLSIASNSMRASSETLSIDDAGGIMLSDMSEEEDEEEESEISEDDSPDEGSLSPSAMAENDLKHRKRDEQRLQLDLTKHQQLLIDSQKMNQSLKRCLGWSEAMINEGKKALEYRVRITDVELGGRVLAADEIEEREAEHDNEGMSDIGARMLREAREKAAGAAVVTWGATRTDDRDSGIELRDAGLDFGDDEEQ